MRANGRRPGLRWGRVASAGLTLTMALSSCSNPASLERGGEELAARGNPGQAVNVRFTGMVDLVWPGGKGMNAPDDDRTAQASIAAFSGASAGQPGPGNFAYRVLAADGSLHREIGVKLTYVHIDVDADTVRFLGEVISDTKPCGGSGHGDDGSGCSHDDDGGCSHDDGDDSHDDGGCSHDDGDDGGCSHDDGDDSHDDGGCSHDDGSDGGGDDHGSPGGSGGHVNGSDCRIGQVVIGWARDGGANAVQGDRISWKWFAPDAPKVLGIEAAIAAGDEVTWPCKLCEKEIIGGNLKVHGL